LSRFTETELEYLQSQQLGRLGTVNKRGEPQVAAVGFQYNPELDTIDIGGHNMTTSQKFLNVARNGTASFLIDDVPEQWKPRSLEIRGHAEALPDASYLQTPGVIRITPKRVIFYDMARPNIGSRRNVE
jgi:pyridoxamine 5'-phosphate oxidase family protein